MPCRFILFCLSRLQAYLLGILFLCSVLYPYLLTCDIFFDFHTPDQIFLVQSSLYTIHSLHTLLPIYALLGLGRRAADFIPKRSRLRSHLGVTT